MKDKKKMDIVTKMTIIGIAAVSVLILVVAVVAWSMRDKTETPVIGIEDLPEITEDNQEANQIDTDNQVIERALAVVQYVDTVGNTLQIYDVEGDKEITLNMDGVSSIKDEYGTEIALAQIDMGDMVEAKYDDVSKIPEYVKITAVTWSRKDLTNMSVDTENKTITFANEVYTYNDQLVTAKEGLPFDIGELTKADDAVVKGYKNQVWSIVLLGGHGTIELANYDIFVGGQMEVGNRTTVDIVKNFSVAVAAGTYNIVISKDNMSPYVTSVVVEEGQTSVIDLSEAQPKVGTVEIVLLQDDVTVFIDDEAVDLSQPLTLDFDTYSVRAEKEGYTAWESEMVVEQAYMQFKIDLEKTPVFVHMDEPQGVEAYLDGVFVGVIPLQTPYEAGTHTVTLRLDGYYTKHHFFDWTDKEEDITIAMPELIKIETIDTTDDTTEDGTGEDTTTSDVYNN